MLYMKAEILRTGVSAALYSAINKVVLKATLFNRLKKQAVNKLICDLIYTSAIYLAEINCIKYWARRS
jgi:hypothetical protein